MAGILITLIIVFYIATLFIEKKVFPEMYAKTSIKPFNFLHKVLCAVIGIVLFLLIPSDGEVPEMLMVGIIIELVAIALLVLLNLKYKAPGMIAKATVIHVIYGIAFSARFFFWFLSVSASLSGLVLGRGIEGKVPSFFGNYDPAKVVEDDRRRRREEEAKKERENEHAEMVARIYGFSSADEAERFGVRTGKID